MRYNGAFYLDPIFQKPNFPNYTPEAIIASYTVFNAGLRLEEAFGSRATVEVYVKNIGDRTYGNGGFASYGSGFASRTLGDPRVFGMSLKLPFGGE
jgi:outer membrane receptor protein involved in Fe transport